jgi:mono/diheme cytochrome c family protein
MRRAWFLAAGVVCFGFCLWALAPAGHAVGDTPVTPAMVARGEYLAHAADCAACHTGADGRLSGGRAFTTPFGTLYASNITPDISAGVGAYSDDEWVAALQQGLGRGGKHLYPAMPYTNYTLMDRADALAIKAYIMTLPKSSAAAPANDMAFPFNIRFLMVFWNMLNNPDRRFAPDAAHDAVWNRGAYLAEALGHCQQCHTPRNFMQGLKTSRAYAGATTQGWTAYNLTGDTKSGIGDWSEADLATYLGTGHATGHGSASGPMAEAVSYSLRYLSADDTAALARYLKAIPGIHTDTPVAAARVAEDEQGLRVYQEACVSCHRLDGTGTQTPYGALAGAHSLADAEGTNLVRMVLDGGLVMTSHGEPYMPGFARGYTDEDIASVSNYALAHFGGVAGHVTPAAVARARHGAAGT